LLARLSRKSPKIDRSRVVGEITEISGDLKALSHQLAVFTHPPTVVSHDLLMHQNLDRFLRQPLADAKVSQPVQPEPSRLLDDRERTVMWLRAPNRGVRA
jgi:hypothetical protein